jgi:DNA helicase-2/ATP-dependent DNA helicase PcrA
MTGFKLHGGDPEDEDGGAAGREAAAERPAPAAREPWVPYARRSAVPDRPVAPPSFNPQQLAAIRHDAPGTAALVLAGAGSGKTTVLTHRVAELIKRGVPPEQILCCTYTRKAADEMRFRLSALVGPAGSRVTANSIHGVGYGILRDNGYDKHTLIAEWEAKRALNDVLGPKRLNWDIGYGYVAKWITEAKLAGVWVEGAQAEAFFLAQLLRLNVADWLARQWAQKLAVAYAHYESEKKLAKKIDFADMVFQAWRLLVNPDTLRAAALQRYRMRWAHVLTDESQDTTKMQLDVLEAIAHPKDDLFAVGDDAQLLFRFAGADVDDNIYGFGKRFPRWQLYPLEVNYRSTHEIVDRATLLIANNYAAPERKAFEKNLRAAPAAARGVPVRVAEYEDAEEEAAATVRQLSVLFAREGYGPVDAYGIYRTNAQSRALEDQLLQAGIPYVVAGGLGFYNRKVVKDVLAYARLLVARDYDEAFERIYNMASEAFGKPTRYLSRKFLDECRAASARSLWEGMELLYRAGRLAGYQVDGVMDLVDTLGRLEAVRSGAQPLDPDAPEQKEKTEAATVVRAVRLLVYDAFVRRNEEVKEDDSNTGTWDDLEELVVAAGHHDTIAAFLKHVDDTLAMMAKRNKEKVDAVVLTTIHKVKGLERKLVFGIGIADGLLPHSRAIGGFVDPERPLIQRGSLEDERCAMFVLCTRAKERLSLSSIRRWRNRDLQPSRFLAEMGLFVEAPPSGGPEDAPPPRLAVVTEVVPDGAPALPPPAPTVPAVAEAELIVAEAVAEAEPTVVFGRRPMVPPSPPAGPGNRPARHGRVPF